MPIETVEDAISSAKALYRGRDQYLFAKWDWWSSHFQARTNPRKEAAGDRNRGFLFMRTSLMWLGRAAGRGRLRMTLGVAVG